MEKDTVHLARISRKLGWVIEDACSEVRTIVRIVVGLAVVFVLCRVGLIIAASHGLSPENAALWGMFPAAFAAVVVVLFALIAPFRTLAIGLVMMTKGRRVMQTIATIIGLGILIGIYAALVPLPNDPGLVPLLSSAWLAILAFHFGVSGPARTLVLIFLSLLIIGITAVFFLGGRPKARERFDELGAQTARAITTPGSSAAALAPAKLEKENVAEDGGQEPIVVHTPALTPYTPSPEEFVMKVSLTGKGKLSSDVNFTALGKKYPGWNFNIKSFVPGVLIYPEGKPPIALEGDWQVGEMGDKLRFSGPAGEEVWIILSPPHRR